MSVLQLNEMMYKVLLKELQIKAVKHLRSCDLEVVVDGETIKMEGGDLMPTEIAYIEAAVEFTLSHLIKIKQ